MNPRFKSFINPVTQELEWELDYEFSDTQFIAWQILFDDTTTEFLFGGGAGGGKSRILCQWIHAMCLDKKGIRALLGRSVLKNLKASTLNTLFDVYKEYGFKKKVHYLYNQQENTITYYNGSVIYLMDLAFQPSDPNYDRIGSTEFTIAGVDEANQITSTCKDVITSRLRYKIDEYGLTPKLLMTCNPAKNWTYSQFYKASRDGIIDKHQAFLQSLVTDNPFISQQYILSLKRMKDKALRERLLFGNWEYDDDPNALFAFEDITDLFTNSLEDYPDDGRYMTVDVARKGMDKSVIMCWKGLQVYKIYTIAKNTIDELLAECERIRNLERIPLSNCIADEDGVGGGLVDFWHCKGFVGGSSPIINKHNIEDKFINNYRNLRSQCYYELANKVREKLMAIKTEDGTAKELIIEELEQIKGKDTDGEGKLAVISKDEIKEHLGRSPDYADTLMMRMYFELNHNEANIRVW